MKKTIACLLIVAVALASAAQTPVLFSLRQMTGSPQNREITITSLDGVRLVGTNLVFPETKVVRPVAGIARTNLVSGNYRVSVAGLSSHVDGFVADTSEVQSWATDCAGIAPAAVSVTQYYTRAQVDALMAAGGGGGISTTTATNIARSEAQSATNTLWSAAASALAGKQDALGFTPLTGSEVTNAAVYQAREATNSLNTSLRALISTKQHGSANLTNWSAIAPSAKQDALGFIPQGGSGNLTNWSSINPATKQDATPFLDIWGDLDPADYATLTYVNDQVSQAMGGGITASTATNIARAEAQNATNGLVPWIQAGLSGASNSTPDVVDVRKFGAHPTNTPAANKVAIDAAIAALTNSVNAVLYFGPGIYQSTGPHVLPESGSVPFRVGANPSVWVKGSGNTFLQCTSTNIGTFWSGGANWADITIAGPGMQHSATGLVQRLPGNNVFRNVEFRDWGGYGMLADDCTYQVYDNIRFFRCHIGYGAGFKNDAVHWVGRADQCNWGVEIGALGPGTISHTAGTTGPSASGYFKIMGNFNTNAIVVVGGSGTRGVTVEVYAENPVSTSTNGHIHIGHDPALWPAAAIETGPVTATIRNTYLQGKRGNSAIRLYSRANLIIENVFCEFPGPMIQNYYAPDDDPTISARKIYNTDGFMFQSYGGYKVYRDTFEWSRHSGFRVFHNSGFAGRQMFEGMAHQTDKVGPFRLGWYGAGGTYDFSDLRSGIWSTNLAGAGTTYQMILQNLGLIQPDKPAAWTWMTVSNYFGADHNVFPRLTLGGETRTNWPAEGGGGVSSIPVSIGVAVSDEISPLTTGTGKVKFRAPHAFTLTAVRASLSSAPAGAALVVDVNESGASVLSTALSIDAGETSSTTAATAAVISDSAIADDAEITIDIDQVGSATAGAGLKVWLIGTRSL